MLDHRIISIKKPHLRALVYQVAAQEVGDERGLEDLLTELEAEAKDDSGMQHIRNGIEIVMGDICKKHCLDREDIEMRCARFEIDDHDTPTCSAIRAIMEAKGVCIR